MNRIYIPNRLQAKRTAGYRIADICKNPNGYKFVDRRSKFGNPYIVKKRDEGFDALYNGVWRHHLTYYETKGLATDESVRLYINYIDVKIHDGLDLSPLHGKDLVCWCSLCPDHRLGKSLGTMCTRCTPCHVDHLINLVDQHCMDNINE